MIKRILVVLLLLISVASSTTAIAEPSYHQGFARSAGESKYPGLWKGLVGAWVPSLGITGKVLRDQASSKKNGTLTGTNWETSEGSRVLRFNNQNDYMIAPGTLDLLQGVNAFTLVGMVKADSWAINVGLFGKYNEPNGAAATETDLEIIYALGGDTITLYMANNDGSVTNFQTILSSPLANTKYQFGSTYDGARLKGFLNGREVFDVAETLIVGNEHPFVISDPGSGVNRFFTGVLYYSYLYNRDLSNAEMYQLHIHPFAPFELADRALSGIAAVSDKLNPVFLLLP